MRAAATVVRLMPSPRNRITFFARPAMAPLAAARAAPARYHHSGVSPAGRAISGTGTCTVAGAGGAWWAAVAAQAPSRVAQRVVARVVARVDGRRCRGIAGRAGWAPDVRVAPRRRRRTRRGAREGKRGRVIMPPRRRRADDSVPAG